MAYTQKVQAVARGLFSPDAAQQLAALRSLQALCSPQPVESDTTSEAFDDVRHVCLAQGLGSLSRRLMELAAPTASSEATQQQLQSTPMASAVWKALWQCCRQPRLQLRQELLASPLLRPALSAALQGFQYCSSSTCPQAFAMRLLECICSTLPLPDERPAWLSSFLPVALQALKVCPLTNTVAISCALEVLWQHCQHPQLLHLEHPELKPLLPDVAAAVLDRQLYLQHPTISVKAARMLGIAACRGFGTAGARARIRSVDLSAVTQVAQWSVIGGPWHLSHSEFWHINIAIDLADHPSFQAHTLHWLVPRLVACIYRHGDFFEVCALMIRLHVLLRLRPDLVEPLLARGLLPAVAHQLMAADPEDQYDRAEVEQVVYTVMMLSHRFPRSFAVAAHASQAPNTAVQHNFGCDLPALQQLGPVQHPLMMARLQQAASDFRASSAAMAAEGAARLRQLGRLRMCAWAGCSRVEDTRGSSLKVCGACKDRAAAANGSTSRARTGSSSGGGDAAAAYCGRACQAADRFGGHAACLLESSLKGVTLANVTPQQRKHLLQLLGCADNAAIKETLDIVYRLFGAAGDSTLHTQRTVEWLGAGFATQLVACMATLEQRRAWCKLAGYAVDQTSQQLKRVLKICCNLWFSLAVILKADPASTAGLTAQLQLHQQLSANGASWLAFALAEAGNEHAEGRRPVDLLSSIKLCVMQLLQQCEEDPAGAGAVEERIRGTLSRATTPAVLDAVAECTLQEVVKHGIGVAYFQAGQWFLLITEMLQEPGQMQHLACHPAFVEAVRRTLALTPQAASSIRTMVWFITNVALKLLSMMGFEDQRTADAIGAAAEQLLPPLYALLVQPFSRREKLSLFEEQGVRTDFAALHALSKSQAGVYAMRKSGWLVKHSSKRVAGWTDEEARLMQRLLQLVHPGVKHGHG